MEFASKTVLVTGGGSGIGKAAALAYAKEGAAVALTYITSAEEAAGVVRDIQAAGGRALAIKADLTQENEVEKVFEQTERELGEIEAVFANAGGIIGRTPTTDMTFDFWREVIDVNLTSTFLTARAAFRRMAPRRRGAIVTMASLAAFNGAGPGAAAYAAAKGAIVAYTRALAKEGGPLGIRVNGVAPGLIATRFHERFNTPQGRQSMVGATPLGCEGSPEDVAQSVLFLSSPRSAFVTGEILQINGGFGFF